MSEIDYAKRHVSRRDLLCDMTIAESTMRYFGRVAREYTRSLHREFWAVGGLRDAVTNYHRALANGNAHRAYHSIASAFMCYEHLPSKH